MAKVRFRDIMIKSIIELHINNYNKYIENSYRFPETFLNTGEALEMKSKCEDIIHQSLQSMRFSRKRHRITKSDAKNVKKALNQSKDRKLAQENKSKYPERVKTYEKRSGDKFINKERSGDKIQNATI